ncbi:MAG: FlgD immunoglobulin-like domain containing protein [Candidatus Cloacimonadales bacterium]|nr:FlgD immunoglobulin-like domain containing protein [Candidatus Cloacimonadales bacterium]
MQKSALTLVFLFFIFSIISAQVVNGDTLTVDGKKILKVWGTHYERGFATGFLVGENIKYLEGTYFIGSIFGGSSMLYESTREFFLNCFSIEDKYQSEAQGMIAGMIDAGIDLFDATLQRDLDKDDILMVNAIVDLIAISELDLQDDFGCSSISSWGNNTINDPELMGDLVITRQMDWTPHPALNDNHILIIHFPAENDEVNWMSFTFPGLFGALSAINEDGISAFMNVGNIHNYTFQQNLHPILLSARNGIESYDYNGDFQSNPQDVADAISDMTYLSGSIVHSANQDYGLIIESNNENGTVIRDESENIIIPFEHLVATNHFRKLYDPIYCYRYQNIADSLSLNAEMSVHRSWEMLGGAAGVSSNLHDIEYAPSLNIVKWSTSTYSIPAYQILPTEFEISELFTMPVSLDNEYIEIIPVVNTFPNPFYESASLSFSLSQASAVDLSIFNIRGQKVKSLIAETRSRGTYTVLWNGRDESDQPLPSGIYFYKFATDYMTESGRLVLVK